MTPANWGKNPTNPFGIKKVLLEPAAKTRWLHGFIIQGLPPSRGEVWALLRLPLVVLFLRRLLIAVALCGGASLGLEREALADSGICSAPSTDYIPQGWSEPLILHWTDDGALDVVSCKQDQESHVSRPVRWATVHMPGIRTVKNSEGKKLILETRDGPIDLGTLASQPCLPHFSGKSRIECAVLFGEKKIRAIEPITWSLSLSLGEDGAIATEKVFSPLNHPMPLTK